MSLFHDRMLNKVSELTDYSNVIFFGSLESVMIEIVILGPNGQTGSTGNKGSRGDTGVRGPQGQVGSVGPAGQSGSTGPKGGKGK